MTRDTNKSMRKMAMTGLMLVGLAMGGMGIVGCDEQQASQAVSQFLSGSEGKPAQAFARASHSRTTSSASCVLRHQRGPLKESSTG